jgi:hypothetical protein
MWMDLSPHRKRFSNKSTIDALPIAGQPEWSRSICLESLVSPSGLTVSFQIRHIS